MKIFTPFFFVLLFSTAHSQETFTIDGIVKNQENEMLSFGDVVLYANAEKPIKFTYIEEGDFHFDPIKAGEYILEISCLGYQKHQRTIQLDENLNLEVQLQVDSQELTEVTVKAERSRLVNKDGNLKLTIDNSIFATQPTTLDALSLMPTIQLSPDRSSISVIGKGSPLIYLDNQRISLDQLNVIPIETIKDVEIINNPSARYEADGRVVILLTRKANISDGLKFNISENASFKRKFNNYLGISGNYKKNKLELMANFSYNRLGHWERLATSFDLPNIDVSSNGIGLSTGPRNQYVFGVGLYYQLKNGAYISTNVNGRTQNTTAPITNSSEQQIQSIKDDIITFADDKGYRSFVTSNINFNKKWSASNLFVGLQYSDYVRGLEGEISNNYNETNFVLTQIRKQDFNINAFAARVDFEKKIGDKTKWEIGIGNYFANASAYNFFDFVETMEVFDADYDYKELNLAGYTQVSGKINKWSYSFGLRAENTLVEGGFREADSLIVDRNQIVLFPRASLNIPIDSTKNLSLNYTKSIQRPNYLSASSITTYISPFFEYARNANLNVSIIQEVAVNFQFDQQSIKLSYVHRKNPNYTNVVFDEETQRLTMSPENFDQAVGYNLSYINPLKFKAWSVTNFLKLSVDKITDNRAVLFDSKPYLYYYSNHQFKLPANTTLGIVFWGLTKRYQGVLERNSMFVIGASLSKQFGKNLHAAINLNDIFRGMIYEDIYSINQINTNSTFYADGRNISFSLKYSFGRLAKSSYKNMDVDDNLKRMN